MTIINGSVLGCLRNPTGGIMNESALPVVDERAAALSGSFELLALC